MGDAQLTTTASSSNTRPREFAPASLHSMSSTSEPTRGAQQQQLHLPLASVGRADHQLQSTEPNQQPQHSLDLFHHSPTFFDFDDMSQYLTYDTYLDAPAVPSSSSASSMASPFAVSPPPWLDRSEPAMSPIHAQAMNSFHQHSRGEGSAGADSNDNHVAHSERKDSTDTVTDARPAGDGAYFARPVQTGGVTVPSPSARTRTALQPQSSSDIPHENSDVNKDFAVHFQDKHVSGGETSECDATTSTESWPAADVTASAPAQSSHSPPGAYQNVPPQQHNGGGISSELGMLDFSPPPPPSAHALGVDMGLGLDNVNMGGSSMSLGMGIIDSSSDLALGMGLGYGMDAGVGSIDLGAFGLPPTYASYYDGVGSEMNGGGAGAGFKDLQSTQPHQHHQQLHPQLQHQQELLHPPFGLQFPSFTQQQQQQLDLYANPQTQWFSSNNGLTPSPGPSPSIAPSELSLSLPSSNASSPTFSAAIPQQQQGGFDPTASGGLGLGLGFNNLHQGANTAAPSPPAWAAQLWPSTDNLPGTSNASCSPSPPRNVRQHPLPSTTPYPIPIPIPNGNGKSRSPSRHGGGGAQRLTGLFQPASAPAGALGFGGGTGYGLAGRVRTYSHRVQRAAATEVHPHPHATGALDVDSMDMDMDMDNAVENMEDSQATVSPASVKRARTIRQRVKSEPELPSFPSVGGDDFDGDAATVRPAGKRRTASSTAAYTRPRAREPSTSPSARGSSVEYDQQQQQEAGSTQAPARSELRPPKLAPSTWQLYFTDWIQRHQQRASLSGDGEEGTRKLNVAQAAKEAGAEYANLTPEQKEPFKRRSQAAKEARERELAAWQKTLTPDAIKRENAFRTAQRKAGKSRKGNIKDPNAPKKPLSAYFMFLSHIRSDPRLVNEVFGGEKETTNQSVLAAQKWRSMTDEERKPFLAQAEKEKLDYEAARRMYEEGTVGFETTISFGNDFIAPPSLLSSSTSNANTTVFSAASGLGQAVGIAPTPALTSGSNSDSDPESEGEAQILNQQQQRPQMVKTPKKKHLRA